MSPDTGGRKHRLWKWIVASILAFMLLITAVSYLFESDALRGYVERQMNSVLKGYTIHIGRAFFHPVSLALDLGNLTLVQNANPDPPVAKIGRLYASVHWRALLRARLVGDLFLDAPKLNINLKNFREEEKSTVPLQQKGWQEAIASVYALKINVNP